MPEDSSTPHKRFYPKLRLLVWQPRGVLDDTLADELVIHTEAEERFDSRPFDRFTDLSRLDTITLHVSHVFNIAQHRIAATAGMPPVKSAFYGNTVVSVGIAQMYEWLMRESIIEVRAFSRMEETAAWLGVDLEILLGKNL